MKSGHNTRQDRPVVNATSDTSDALIRARTLAQPVCTAAAKAAAPAAEGTTAGDAKKGAPGFTAVFVIAGMLVIAYAMMRRSG